MGFVTRKEDDNFLICVPPYFVTNFTHDLTFGIFVSMMLMKYMYGVLYARFKNLFMMIFRKIISAFRICFISPFLLSFFSV